jgi:hypothetical protein
MVAPFSPLDTFHTQLQLILPDIKQRLMNVLDFPADRVFFWQGDGDPPFHAEAQQYVWMTLEGEADDLPIMQGAGRIDARETQILRVVARTRVSLDPGDRHDIALMDQTYGILALAHLVKVALVDYFPVDVNGNILAMPMKPRHGGNPRPIPKQEWMEKTLWFEILYELDLPDILPMTSTNPDPVYD